MDQWLCYEVNGKKVWVTEVGYAYNNLFPSTQAYEMQQTYVDMFNRTYCWTKTFYHILRQDQYGLLNPDGTPRLSYSSYKSMTGH